MKILILLLLPMVTCAQRLHKGTNPNDEPFLPIHPEYPYNPKLMKRGLEQQQQSQVVAQLTPELYAPKVDSRDSYSASYSQSPYYPTYDQYSKSTALQNSLASSPLYQSSYSSYGSNPYSLLSLYGSPYGSAASGSPYGSAAPGSPYGSAAPGSPYGSASPGSPYGSASSASPYASAAPGVGVSPPGLGTTPYPTSGAYPSYYYQPPYYYPGYYNQPPYPPPPPGYPGAHSKHKHNDDDDDDEDDRRREKSKKASGKNRLRDSDRDVTDNHYVDGNNYIISSAKDLDGESSTHRTPSHYNQIEDSEVQTRTAVSPKSTYRLVSISGQQPSLDAGPNGYIKVQQLEQLMRQALARLLAQNAAQQANLAQIQQAATQQVNTNAIAKTGLSYVVNPTILSRVNPGEYNPSQLVQTQSLGGSKQLYVQKPTTSVTLQQSPGIYIPPTKSNNDQQSSQDYGDYDSTDNNSRSQPSIINYQSTSETTQRNNYPYSTYRPTPQTNLEDVNFGTKQKTKS